MDLARRDISATFLHLAAVVEVVMDAVQERRDHVVRERPPWYAEQVTECGRVVADDPDMPLITAEQLMWRVKREGKQRTAFTVCMTCWSTASTHHGRTYSAAGLGITGSPLRSNLDVWDVDPADVLIRELRRPLPHDRDDPRVHQAASDRRAAELHAVAQLIEAHRAEFDALCVSMEDGIWFRRRRAQQDREKREKGQRP